MAVVLWDFLKYCSVIPQNDTSILFDYIANTNLDTCWLADFQSSLPMIIYVPILILTSGLRRRIEIDSFVCVVPTFLLHFRN